MWVSELLAIGADVYL